MAHPHEDGLNPAEAFNSRLKSTVFRLREAIGADDSTFTEMLGVSQSRFDRLKAPEGQISTREALSLASALDIDLDLIFEGAIDYAAFARQHCGDRAALPERYLGRGSDFTRARAMNVILGHLKIHHGKSFARDMLRRFQLHAEAFSDPVRPVSPLIYEDIFNELESVGYTPEQLRAVGTMTLVVNRQTLGPLLAQHRTPQELYTYVHEELFPKHYDRLCDYKLVRLTDKGCMATIHPREEALECFEGKLVGSRPTCLYKQGVYMSFLANISAKYPRIFETSCLYRGDPCCTFHLSWE